MRQIQCDTMYWQNMRIVRYTQEAVKGERKKNTGRTRGEKVNKPFRRDLVRYVPRESGLGSLLI
jgi:hypothetical protein